MERKLDITLKSLPQKDKELNFLFLRLVLFSTLFTTISFAHQERFSYIYLDYNNTSPSLLWEIESSGFKFLIDVNQSDNSIYYEELLRNKDKIINYSKEHFLLKLDNKKIDIDFDTFKIKEFSKIYYVAFETKLPRLIPNDINITYNLFFKTDNLTRCFVTFRDKNSTSINTLFPFNEELILNIEEQTTLFLSLKEFFINGIWHILMGIDHILFLLMLIIPSVKNQNNIKLLLINVLKLITAFSIAHSTTLALSALEIVSIDSKIIDVLIGISIIFTATNNILNKTDFNSYKVAFLFGLIHGFGFANALSNLVVTKELFIYFLAIFNIGIEVGQLLIIIIILPLICILRETSIYEKAILKGFSLISILIALFFICFI